MPETAKKVVDRTGEGSKNHGDAEFCPSTVWPIYRANRLTSCDNDAVYRRKMSNVGIPTRILGNRIKPDFAKHAFLKFEDGRDQLGLPSRWSKHPRRRLRRRPGVLRPPLRWGVWTIDWAIQVDLGHPRISQSHTSSCSQDLQTYRYQTGKTFDEEEP